MEDVIRLDDVQSAIESYLGPSSFTVQRSEVEKFSDDTLGIMGRHYKITATVNIEDETQELNFFAKLPPSSSTSRTSVANTNYFFKEVFMYDKLVPELNLALPSGTTLPVPKCVLSRLAKDEDDLKGSGEVDERLIILEDVTHKGYRLTELGKPLDLAHCQCVLKSLSRLHASSILLEESLRITHPALNASKDIFQSDKLNWMSGMNWAHACAESMTSAVSKLWPERFKDNAHEVLSALADAWKRVYAMAYVSNKYSNVLCHLDLWTNNMLFAYDSKREKGVDIPIDVLFVDFQFVHYTPPALDIVLFLHICTEKRFRDENLEELLKYYYSSMGEYVSGDLLKRVFPFSSLVDSVEEFVDYGIVKSTGYLPIVLEEVIPRDFRANGQNDMREGILRNRGDQIVWNCSQSELYRERIEESFKECLQRLKLWK